MTLSEEYERQFALRSWQKILDLLPDLGGRRVLDLGCSIGDQAAELAARGASVLGIDSNEELVAAALERSIPRAAFQLGDLAAPLAVEGLVDGIWSSFAPAYFPELAARLAAWKQHLEPGGWIALTEVDDLFGHEPLRPETRALLDAYAHDALSANRYDFYMGHKLRAHLERAGLTVLQAFTVEDQEFSFDGPATPEALLGWASRLDRMRALQRFCGSEFDNVRRDFLAALASPAHRSASAVHCCVARHSEGVASLFESPEA